jgi:integrase
MPRECIPKYRRQKRSKCGGGGDLAFVEISGSRVYLGAFDSKESRTAYDRVIAEWLANGRRVEVPRESLTVVELIERFWRHSREYYGQPTGTPRGELGHIRRSLKPVRKLYGDFPVDEFGPKALKVVRQTFVDDGLCRRSVNREIQRIRRMFKWGVAEEHVESSVYEALRTVDGLRRGRTQAPESRRVKPVPCEHVAAVRPFVSRQVWAVIQLQLLTGARSGELLILRGGDLDTTGKIWTYTPAGHKTAYRDHQRVIYVGPRAQQIVRPFLIDRSASGYLFHHERRSQSTSTSGTRNAPRR